MYVCVCVYVYICMCVLCVSVYSTCVYDVKLLRPWYVAKLSVPSMTGKGFRVCRFQDQGSCAPSLLQSIVAFHVWGQRPHPIQPDHSLWPFAFFHRGGRGVLRGCGFLGSAPRGRMCSTASPLTHYHNGGQ